MAIKAVVGFAITLFALMIFGGIALAIVNNQRGRRARPGVIISIVGVFGAAILGSLNAGLVLIEPNEVGVVFRQTASGDQALLEPLSSGLKWVVPFIDQVIIYDAGQQSVTMAGIGEGEAGGRTAVRTISSDGQIVYVDATVIYRVDRVNINDIHRNWRGGYLDAFIVPQTRSEVRNAISQYGAEEIYSGGRAALETQIFQALEAKLAREGLLLTDFLIRDISFSQEFTDAIEQKQIAEQEARQAAFRVQQAEQEAQQAVAEAQGLSDSAVIAAEGDAAATILRAEADAEALDLINQVLSENPALLQWQYINQLGDNVQLILIPSNSPYLFDLQSLMEEAGATPVTTVPTPSP